MEESRGLDSLLCATGRFPGWDSLALWCRDQIKPFQVDGGQVGVRALLALFLGILWQGRKSPADPTPRHFTAWPLRSPFHQIQAQPLCPLVISRLQRNQKWLLFLTFGLPWFSWTAWASPFLWSFVLITSALPRLTSSLPSCVCSWQVPPEGPVFWGGCTPYFTVDSLGLSFHSLQRHFYLENT